ncbi:MAG: hypothetical protein A3A33_02295 [Candidatus Yanofskybacteria bacterium RIFCSPLOWO2_01_FULL_49_25]|uniref:Uncharacterized protein n=1 Tax=Candidatus Yanofskybacteria bacterium RIFCSPLOWO2_01_FULL_49_25 TaxID=1802701 RepID=A0A1F8GRW3_9BACT|nr:MAG: hypothetical protein A3A33_02295 [Candidatus Yanofskybacteria bacterium RIFCSPLOWO2_01_FULL_49_25]
MPIDVKKNQKKYVIDLRKKGLSYSEIGKELAIPKSTISLWLKKVKLTDAQRQRLSERRVVAARANSKKRKISLAHKIEVLKNASAKNIQQISKREFWLMGIMLYWREQLANKNKNDLYTGVQFTSGDPHLIKFFLRWLQEVGRLKKGEILFDIFTDSTDQTIQLKNKAYWSRISGFDKKAFARVYIQKRIKHQDSMSNRKKRVRRKKIIYGLLRIRVRASSMLARQIAGWVSGIQNFYWGSG